MGSGTTAVAAMLEDRHYLGFELDKGYYDTAMRRIDETSINTKKITI